ncbi:MAG: MarR family winged helix-turn-helix transcriptional regulator [Nitrospirota bacterium]
MSRAALMDHHEREWQPVAKEVSTGLTKISLALRSHAWRASGAHHISPTQGHVLSFLRSHPHPPMTLTAIAGHLGITPATASQAVQALVRKGLVRKSRSNTDARAVSIFLSAKGRQKAEQAARSDFLATAVESLHPIEQEHLLTALTKLVRTLPGKSKTKG